MMKNSLVISLTLIVGSVWFQSSHAENLPADTVDSFEKLFGVTEGKRRNHTKGFCFEGELAPSDSLVQDFTTSPLFTATSGVIGRFSHKGGKNSANDAKIGEYGMALKITAENGEQHLMALNTLDFFPVSTPEAFLALNRAKAGGKEAMATFKKQYPEITRYAAHMAKKTKTLKPYEAMVFNSINSFYLLDSDQKKTAIRWSFKPRDEQMIVVSQSQNFFFDNIKQNLANQPITWDMVITIANEGDPVNDPAVLWEGNHTEITAATLTLTSVMTEEQGKCDSVNFDPLVVSSGFEPSEDPILHARRPSYAISFSKRMSEKE